MTKTSHHRKWNSGTRRRVAGAALALTIMLVPVVAASHAAQAQTYSVLYGFTGPGGTFPYAGLIFDAKGNLYGTTYAGGASDNGVVFKLSSKGEETVLYSFTGGADGSGPYAGLIFDAKGNLYGTTWAGGASGAGVVFKLSSKGKETVLHSFTGGADGKYPASDLIFDANGNLYGTTYAGGGSGAGVVFKLSSKGKETVLHSFTGRADGGGPGEGLIFDTKENLYGTTHDGGAYGNGVVFRVTSKGKETVLHSFTGEDGARPNAGLIFDAKENLYGTTDAGGGYGNGVVFKVSSKGKETVLHSFTGEDGADPYARLIFDAKGNLYGTTYDGGAYGGGVVFKLSSKGKETVLYSFTPKTSGGAYPYVGLIFDANGNLYGTTAFADSDTYGVVFKLTP